MSNHPAIMHAWRAFSPAFYFFVIHEYFVRVIDIYAVIPWFDIPAHIGGGMTIAYAAAYAATKIFDIQVKKNNWLFHCTFALAITALFAIIWEWYEFLYDVTFGTAYQPSISDIMYDMAFGLLGALVYACWASRQKKA